MTARTPANAEVGTPDVHTDLSELDAQALIRPLIVVKADSQAWGDSGVAVYHEDRRHIVSPAAKFCDCLNVYYRQRECQHLRCVEFSLGLRTIPVWVARSAIDLLLRERLKEWEGSA